MWIKGILAKIMVGIIALVMAIELLISLFISKYITKGIYNLRAVCRELKMVELKEEIKKLTEELE